MFGWVRRGRFAALRRSSELIALARAEAAERGSDLIDTNDLLFAISRMTERSAWQAIESFGVTPNRMRVALGTSVRRDAAISSSAFPLTPMSLLVIERASNYARMLGDYDLEPEHVFLAFLGEPRCEAYRVLVGLGLKPQELGMAVIRIAGWPVPAET